MLDSNGFGMRRLRGKAGKAVAIGPPPVPPRQTEGMGGNPLPPGSFPGGETLGLPPGLKIPGPLSWQALLGLWDWDCAGGVCIPEFGSDFEAPAQSWEGYRAYAACLVGALPTVLSASAIGIGGTAALGKSFMERFPVPAGILRKLPERVATNGLKWGTKGQVTGAAVFAVTFEVELNRAAKSCSQSTGYLPWVLQ